MALKLQQSKASNGCQVFYLSKVGGLVDFVSIKLIV